MSEYPIGAPRGGAVTAERVQCTQCGGWYRRDGLGVHRARVHRDTPAVLARLADPSPLAARRRPTETTVCLPPEHVQQQAACKGKGHVMYVPEGTKPLDARALVEQARELCRTCPVLWDCREHAIEADQRYGVWGGMTPDERRRARKQGRAS